MTNPQTARIAELNERAANDLPYRHGAVDRRYPRSARYPATLHPRGGADVRGVHP